MHGYHGEYKSDWPGYANDIELFFYRLEDFQKTLELLQSNSTKTIIFNFKYVEETSESECPGSISRT